MLSVQKGLFGKLKPTERQLGWSYGFCDGFAQSIGLEDDQDFIIFISMTFERVYGKRGLEHFRKIGFAQDRYLPAIMEGGTAHHRWLSDMTPPLMPQA